MAFWQRKKGASGGGGRVFVYYSDAGVQRVLPRSGTAHLDGEPDHNVAAWVRDWELRRGGGAAPAEIPAQYRRWIEEYSADLESRRKSPKTVGDHVRMLHTYVIPYFVGARRHDDPNEWPRSAAKFAEWMRGREETEHQLARANAAVMGFWEWLGHERHILAGLGIRLRPSRIREVETPLKRVVKPDEMLAWVRKQTSRDIQLLGLVGYFFSLRPQETFALRKCDFLAGSKAAELEACQVMAQHQKLLPPETKLFGRLAVHVYRQLTQAGEFEPPKAYSVGWVSCFDVDAARLLVELLRDMEPEARLFEHLPDWGHKLWRRAGLGLTLKDLRRASGYWLGHYTTMDRSKLRGHMRHKKEETTQKYMRRPGENPDGAFVELDLDA